MKCHHVVVTQRGGPENLQVVVSDLRPPLAGEVRIKVLAVPVCLPDVQVRYGQSPYPQKIPFVPGYSVIGEVESTGTGVFTAIGSRVAALTVIGGYTEYMLLKEKDLIPVPDGLDPAEAAALILNYLVAYQILHRSARIKAGAKVLIIGASGGIGTAFLQLGKLAGLKMYGLASGSKHSVVKAYGAVPIDYRTQDFVEVVCQAEPDGLDAVFDGVGGDTLMRALSVLRPGGTYVGYGNPLSLGSLLHLLWNMIRLNLLPSRKKVKLYGTSFSIFNRRPFLEDWAALFKLLEEGKIKPVIMKKFPLMEAMQANALLESGQVIGNLVLVSPELLAV